jgi:Phage-like element PBSX protein XtrA
MARSNELLIDPDKMSVDVPLVRGKVMVVVIDGKQGKATITEAVEHGLTIVETVKGKHFRYTYEESELV